ncbi:MAG: RNase P subunit p30 family protein [archaeon]
MRRTADLHLRPETLDEETIRRMADLAGEMRFSFIAVVLDLSISDKQKKDVLRMFKDRGIEAFTRTDLVYMRKQDLLRGLSKARARFDIVAVKCVNQPVSSVGFRDRRVDLVYFDPERPRSRIGDLFFKHTGRPVEVNLADILDVRFMSFGLRRAMQQVIEAKRHRVPILVSSGARNALSMSGSEEMAAFASILGLAFSESRQVRSDVPIRIIEDRLSKRSPGYVSEGVRVVES